MSWIDRAEGHARQVGGDAGEYDALVGGILGCPLDEEIASLPSCDSDSPLQAVILVETGLLAVGSQIGGDYSDLKIFLVDIYNTPVDPLNQLYAVPVA